MFLGTLPYRYRMILWIAVAMATVGESSLFSADNANSANGSTPPPTSISNFSDSFNPTASDSLTATPEFAQNATAQTPLPPASQTSEGEKNNSFVPILQILLTLVTLVGGLLLLNRWIRHRFPSTVVPRLPDGLFEVLGRATLTTRQTVLLVRFGSKLILIATTPTGPVPLVETEEPTEIDEIFRKLGRSNPMLHVSQNVQNEALEQSVQSPQRSQTAQNDPSQHASPFRDIYQTTLQRMRRGETGETRSERIPEDHPERKSGGMR